MKFSVILGLATTAIAHQCDFESLFTPPGMAVKFASIDWMRNCIDSLPFDEQARAGRDQNAVAVQKALEWFYSYKDLGRDSLNNDANPTDFPIFNVTVDFDSRIEEIKNKEYENALEYHFDLGRLVGDFRDAHTQYTSPLTPGLLMLNPVQYTSIMEDGRQVYKIIGPAQIQQVSLADAYNFAHDLEEFPLGPEHFNQVVVSVNGQEANEFFANLAFRTCVYKDKAVCVNNLVKNDINPLDKGLPSDDDAVYPETLNFEFANGETASIKSSFIFVAPQVSNFKNFYESLYISTMESYEKTVMTDMKELVRRMKKEDGKDRDAFYQQLFKTSTLLDSTSFVNAKVANDILAFDNDAAANNYNKIPLPSQMCSQDGHTCFVAMPDNSAIIVSLTSFMSDEVNLFTVFGIAAAYSAENGIDKIVIDVSSNGGGIVASAHTLLRWLVPGWNTEESTEACNDVDFRDSEFWSEYDKAYFAQEPTPEELTRPFTDVDQEGLKILTEICGFYAFKPTGLDEQMFAQLCGWLMQPPSVQERVQLYQLMQIAPIFNPHNSDIFQKEPVKHMRGGVDAKYSPKHNEVCKESVSKLTLCDQDGKAFWWEDIRVVSDGACGSACALFTSKLWLHKKATLFTYGGIAEEKMNFASFHGGNVEQGDAFWHRVVFATVAGALATGDYSLVENMGFLNLATNGKYSFNFHEGYSIGHRSMGEDPLPREFYRIHADYHLNMWPSRDPQQQIAPIVTALYQPISNTMPGTIEVEEQCQFLFAPVTGAEGIEEQPQQQSSSNLLYLAVGSVFCGVVLTAGVMYARKQRQSYEIIA